MVTFILLAGCFLLHLFSTLSCGATPSVFVALLVRNKAHSLPYVLHGLENLDYPKDKISIWIAVDHSQDNSANVVIRWTQYAKQNYANVHYIRNDHPIMFDDGTVYHWPVERVNNLLQLKQQALDSARLLLADYVFYLDADVVLTNENTFWDLINANVSMVGPMLNSTSEPNYASNFWGDIDLKSGFYKRSDNYFDIQRGHKKGVHLVSLVHSALMIRLPTRMQFYPIMESYPKEWTWDDMPITCHTTATFGLQVYVLNSDEFGFFEDTEWDYFEWKNTKTLEVEIGAFKHLLLEYFYKKDEQYHLSVTPALFNPFFGTKRKFGFDEIFLVNLKRRPDRLAKMRYKLDVLGISYSVFEAVDGKVLNQTYLASLGVRMMSGYADPYHNRSLTLGEVGCFLSHYFIWVKMVENNWERILILEDDLRFHNNFEQKLMFSVAEADLLVPRWDLLYFGRKIMESSEKFVAGSAHLVYPSYTYWTLSYAISLAGAQKLLHQSPLSRMVAVDEYLPIMFDQHPNTEWKANFSPRNMLALSAQPLLVEPTYYVGMKHYVSDTEKSSTLPQLLTKSTTCTTHDVFLQFVKSPSICNDLS